MAAVDILHSVNSHDVSIRGAVPENMKARTARKLRAALEAYRKGRLGLAFTLYQQLAHDGHSESQVFVAWMLSEGIGCPKDESTAAMFFEQAAAQDHPIGSFYFARWLTKQGEHERAYGFYHDGARRNHLPSVFRVGYSLARGRGVPTDLRRAYKTLGVAARQGHAFAMREIAIQDLRGRRGFVFRPLGALEFLVAVCWGVVVSLVRADSDLLRG